MMEDTSIENGEQLAAEDNAPEHGYRETHETQECDSNAEVASENGIRSTRKEMDDEGRYDAYGDPMDGNYKKRYEGKRLTLKDKQDIRKAFFINVYPNGATSGFRICYSRKNHATLDKLIEAIGKKAGIRVDCLYKWPAGTKVGQLAEVEEQVPGQPPVFISAPSTVVKDKKKLLTGIEYHHMPYEGKGSSRDTNRSNKYSSNTMRSSMSPGRSNNRPQSITVISSTNTRNRQSVLVNSSRPFEELLQQVTDVLRMGNRPCVALCPLKQPREMIYSHSSFNHLLNKYRITQFYAVGEDEDFQSPSPRDLSPRNGYGKPPNRSTKNGMRQNGYYDNDRMTNGYDRNGVDDDYEDANGRRYRRQMDDDRGGPDGIDDDNMYSDRGDYYDRRRRDPPGKSPQRGQNQRKIDDRTDRGRDDDIRDIRERYRGRDEYEDKRYNGQEKRYDNRNDRDRGRNDRDQDDTEERDRNRGKKDSQRDQRASYDKQTERSRKEETYRSTETKRQVTKREDKGRDEKVRDNSKRRSDGRDDSEDRKYGRGRQDAKQDDRRKSDRNRDESGARNGKRDDSEDRNRGRNDRGRRDSDKNDRGRRDSDRNDRGRKAQDRDDSRDRNDRDQHNRRNSNDDDNGRGDSRSVSPTDSEIEARKADMDNVDPDQRARDNSVIF